MKEGGIGGFGACVGEESGFGSSGSCGEPLQRVGATPSEEGPHGCTLVC